MHYVIRSIRERILLWLCGSIRLFQKHIDKTMIREKRRLWGDLEIENLYMFSDSKLPFLLKHISIKTIAINENNYEAKYE